MSKRITFNFVLCLFLLCSVHCGSSGTSSTTTSQNALNNELSASPNDEQNSNLNYTLHLNIDADDDYLDFTLDLNEEFLLPMSIDSNGSLRIRAADIPQMIHRVCSTSSKQYGCDAYTDALGGMDIDVVIDACGRLVSDDNCGSMDKTVFTGSLLSNGTLNINNMSMRMRIFEISGSKNGVTASLKDPGLITLNRIIISLTSGSTTSGKLKDKGSSVNGSHVVLVSSGQLSSTVPIIGNAHFLVKLTGEFDRNPMKTF